MNKQRERLSEDGMSLLELMFAGGVVAMALSCLFGSMLNMDEMGNLSEGRGLAVNHLSGVMEEVRGLSLVQLVEYVPPVMTGVGVSESIQIQIHASDGTVLELPLSTGLPSGGEDPAETLDAMLPNPYRADVTLTWQDRRGHVFSVAASELEYR